MKIMPLYSSNRSQKSGLKWLATFLVLVGLVGCQVQVEDDAGQDDNSSQSKKEQPASDKGHKNKQTVDNQAEQNSVKKTEPPAKPAIPVEVTKLKRGDIQQTYRAITTLEAEREAQIVARSTGVLQELRVEEGDMVRKGQLLAQLDVAQLALEVQRLEATTSKLRKEKQRQESLIKRNLTSRDTLDRARYEYQAQSAQLELSKLKLNYASIKAPFDGMIVERYVKPGNLIRESDLLFKIVDLNSLKAVLYLPETELKNIRRNQLVHLQIPAVGEHPVTGHIERIRPTVDSKTGTFRVVAAIENPDHQLKTGMFGRVEVVFDEHKNSLLLEQEAIVTQDNRSHVFVIRNNQAIQTSVKTGFRRDGMTEILEGLKDDDLVVTTGQQILKHQSPVEIVNKEVLAETTNSGTVKGTNQSVVGMQ